MLTSDAASPLIRADSDFSMAFWVRKGCTDTVTLRFNLGDEFRSQEWRYPNGKIVGLDYHCKSSTLAVLQSDSTLCLSRLALCPDKGLFERSRCNRVSVPHGFCLCEQGFWANRVVLLRRWDCLFHGREIRKNELLFVDTATTEVTSRIVPDWRLERSVEVGSRVLVDAKHANGVSLSLVEINC